MGFALNNPNADKIPVLIIIKFIGTSNNFSISQSGVSAFAGEEEVLVQDGVKYLV